MKIFNYPSITTGLAIFAMLFGAGNLIFPMKVGITSGSQIFIGLSAFLLTGVFIPLAGLIGIILFNGDYNVFFERLGKIPGQLFIFLCMLTIGPLLVMPRIIDLSFELIKPFINGYMGIYNFSIIFSILTFIFCYKRNSLINLIGKVLSPLILILLLGITIFGFITGTTPINVEIPSVTLFVNNLLLGYNTLDLLGAIFFGFIIISILKETNKNNRYSDKELLGISVKSSLLGGALLVLVYAGISITGALHGQGLENLNVGKMFIQTMLKLLDSKGALLITSSVFLACLATIIALASVVSEYLSKSLSANRISYIYSLIFILIITTFLAQLELEKLMLYSEPLILMFYPALIMLTLCNIAYKLFNFKPVKLPVALTLLFGIYYYGPQFTEQFNGFKFPIKFNFESIIQQ